jgi:hypothetical protein
MCYSSCLFTLADCNAEMVSCLKQICPRCMPASATAMCSVYDSVAVQVTNSLSVFACYPCCANLANSPNSGNNTNSLALPTVTTTLSQNGGGSPINNAGLGPMNVPVGAVPTNNGVSNNGGNGGSNQVNNGNQGGANGGSNAVNAVAPGNGLTNNNGANTNNGPVRKQTTTRRTTKRVVTTRRAASTTRTPAQAQKKPQANKPIKN